MDYETKLYLDNLIEAIKSPDWWIIILTAINIGAFVFVAYTQIKLQKQQTQLQKQQSKAQEYEIYKQMYISIKIMNDVIDDVLYALHTIIIQANNADDLKDELDDLRNRIYKALKSLQQQFIDFDLKLPQGDLIIKEYRDAVVCIVFIINHIRSVARKSNGIKYQPTEIDTQDSINDLDNDILLQSAIVARLIDEKDARRLNKQLERYIERKENLLSKKYLESIKERCKID